VPGDARHFYFSFCEAEQREDSFSSSQVLLSTQPDFIRAIIFYNSSYSNNEFVPNIIQDQHAVFIFGNFSFVISFELWIICNRA